MIQTPNEEEESISTLIVLLLLSSGTLSLMSALLIRAASLTGNRPAISPTPQFSGSFLHVTKASMFLT